MFTMTSMPEIVDSVYTLKLVVSRVSIENIYEQLEISVVTAHKVLDVNLIE